MSYGNCPFFTIHTIQRHWKINFSMSLYSKFVKKRKIIYKKSFFIIHDILTKKKTILLRDDYPQNQNKMVSLRGGFP